MQSLPNAVKEIKNILSSSNHYQTTNWYINLFVLQIIIFPIKVWFKCGFLKTKYNWSYFDNRIIYGHYVSYSKRHFFLMKYDLFYLYFWRKNLHENCQYQWSIFVVRNWYFEFDSSHLIAEFWRKFSLSSIFNATICGNQIIKRVDVNHTDHSEKTSQGTNSGFFYQTQLSLILPCQILADLTKYKFCVECLKRVIIDTSNSLSAGYQAL